MAAPSAYTVLDRLLGAGALPDPVLRLGSRAGIHLRLRREQAGGVAAQDDRLRALIERMSTGPIAEGTAAANEQHYELPPEFFALFLGPRMKYSGCLWPERGGDLAGAEEAMLALVRERAGIEPGMRVLDLGCGWGSMSLWLAEHVPALEIVGVSNSHSQRAWIEAERDRRGLGGVEIVTADVNDFDPATRFDRVVSIEMFEHMRNWKALLARIAGWLEPDGRAFVHTFSHRRLAYRFEGTWAAERFFTAGLMPSHELLARFQDDLVVADRWAVPGTHYARTLRAWLDRLDARADEALAILELGHGRREARRLLATWRLFLLSTEEIWGWRGGNEWLVSHYLLERRGGNGTKPLVRAT